MAPPIKPIARKANGEAEVPKDPNVEAESMARRCYFDQLRKLPGWSRVCQHTHVLVPGASSTESNIVDHSLVRCATCFPNVSLDDNDSKVTFLPKITIKDGKLVLDKSVTGGSSSSTAVKEDSPKGKRVVFDCDLNLPPPEN